MRSELPHVMTLGLVTCSEIGLTDDDALFTAVLEARGVAVTPVNWDAGEPPSGADAFILRSPWNYHLQPDAFLAWIDRASQRGAVWNEPSLVRWNSHKEYLFDLRDAGIPVAETVLCAKHAASDLRSIMRERGWDEVVVKPAISASSFMTAIVGLPGVEDGQHLLESILETRDALVQPFMPEIFERGERSLTFIDGAFSHAAHKTPFTSVCGKGSAVAAEPEEIRLAQRALAVVSPTPLYARVDLLRGADGVDRVMELELIDPELYLRFSPDAPQRLARAILRRL